MASKKGSKEVVQLRNSETGVFYITTKNTKSENTKSASNAENQTV